MIRHSLVLGTLLGLAACAAAPPSPPDTPAPPARPPAATTVSSRALSCMAEAIYFEARGTTARGEKAVGHVIVNRAAHPEFPDTVCGVVADRCQFSYRCDGLSDVPRDQTAFSKARAHAREVLQGARDFTSGALFFHAKSVSPRWFRTREEVGTFGGNVFYQ